MVVDMCSIFNILIFIMSVNVQVHLHITISYAVLSLTEDAFTEVTPVVWNNVSESI